MNYKEQIIRYIKTNRVSTTEITDCMDKTGVIPNALPLNRGHVAVGPIHWVYTYGESNWHLHEQIQEVKEGSIVFIEEFDCNNRAVFGDIVAKYLILYRQVEGIVTTGKVRDAARLIKENWPVWSDGVSPVGCFNTKPDYELDKAMMEHRRDQCDDAIMVCDDTGAVVIPRQYHNKEFIKKMEFIEGQEDVWYECIDRRKWNTFETICLQRYHDEKD